MKFKVGDIVKVRGWDEMAAEFPHDEERISCSEISFVKQMRDLCGKTAIVEAVDDDEQTYELRPIAVEDMGFDWGWFFTDEMLKGACE